MYKKYLYVMLPVAVFIFLAYSFSFFGKEDWVKDLDWHHLWTTSHAKSLGFDLKDPEEAPPSIRESVIRGYHLVLETPKHAPNYVGDKISCTNCHFAAGDSLGGRNNGISLVGVTAVYPHYSSRDKKTISLADRVNNCFMRSMNGHSLPVDSQEMKDILNYLAWISKEFDHLKQMPWLGLATLKKDHRPNIAEGRHQYQLKCSPCHAANGEGSTTAPPLWGENSFNDGAGMNNLGTFASFVYLNMPKGNAFLSEEQAWDISAFVVGQPRPHFEAQN